MADPTRRAVLGALLGAGAGAAAVSPLADALDAAAPLSGRAWRNRGRDLPETVVSPHGDASVAYDEYHVPHVQADGEAAAYYAIGYVHAADRLFQMDLIRRLMSGRLSEVVGPATLDSDRFHVQMDFRGGAAATESILDGTHAGALVSAYAAGVNARIDDGERPLEFDLLEFDPEPWRPLDTYLIGQQIAWGLTGSFRTLRLAVLRNRLSATDFYRLYEQPFDHGVPILSTADGNPDRHIRGADTLRGVDPNFIATLADHEPPRQHGSNHWAVAGRRTTTGKPMLAYDPHLTLMAPPVWYEQHLQVPGVDVRGAAFPGVPFVIVGENAHGAWGFTNTGADVIDFYTYETEDGMYRYRDDWHSFASELRTIPVSGGSDREVTVRKTVHGPFIERTVGGQSTSVGISWTGFSATREPQAIHAFSRTSDVEEFKAALRWMDVPTQNALYIDEQETYYKVTGKIPIRRVDGEIVRGDRVFDGSAAEAEWDGFTPFARSSWDGFIPFEATPEARDSDVIATANQRPVDDPVYPIGQDYASGFRARRIAKRLHTRLDDGNPVDRSFMIDLQQDTVDERARELVPAVLEARDMADAASSDWLDTLENWDYRMERDSPAALVFDRFIRHFRELTWSDAFDGLGPAYYPKEWRLVSLPSDDPYFDGERSAIIARAIDRAIAEINAHDWDTYGDLQRTTIDHRLGAQVDGLNYPRYPTDGTGFTVFNVKVGADHGSSWRQISTIDGTSLSILPGGQSGEYFSPHYDDQLRRWADGEYKPMTRSHPTGGGRIEFEEP
ncbi:MAG: penicillin acylase family protein [Salinirussus sp.]